MKVIFLHGLGQSAASWNEVTEKLEGFDCQALELFPDQLVSYQEIKERVLAELMQQREDFVLVGLSLGGVLALDLSDLSLPHLKGLVLSGSQYKLKGNLLYLLQIFLFQLMPKRVFAKGGADKGQLLQILQDLRGLDLTEKAKALTLPSLVICGDMDKPNLKPAKELECLLPQSSFTLISDGGHTLNSQKPAELAGAIADFVRSLADEK